MLRDHDRSTVDAIKDALSDPREVVERLGLAQGAKWSGPRSGHILCPWHNEDTPSCHVWVKGGRIAVKCHGSCAKGGDVLSLIAAAERLDLARDFRTVLERGAEMASVPMPARGASDDDPGYPPQAEVQALWEAAVPADRCPDATAWLESRGLVAALVAQLDLARSIPVGARLPAWARYSGRPWIASGHRLLVPMFDGDGALRSVRARCVKAGEGAKAVPPSRHRMAGLVMASPGALTMLRGGEGPGRLIVAEGEPDFLTWACRGEATVGIGTGAWTGAHAEHVPEGCVVVVWTDVDAAGDAYAALVAETLAGHARLLRRQLEDKRDANDLLQAGALPDDPAAGALEMASPDPDPRPVVRVGPELHITTDRAIRALRGDDGIYQRDGRLVCVTGSGDAAPTIRPVSLATMRERLTGAARFERKNPRAKPDDPEWTRCIPPDNVAHAVLDRGEWSDIRTLVGVLEAPGLRPDGSVLEEPGYDLATRYLYAPRCRFPRVPDTPLQADAARALRELEAVFVDFPYRSPADRSAVIASALTLLARPAIDGAVPAFLFDATTPGSGKTLQADVVAILATGRTTAKMAFPVDDDEETEKILGGYALEGAQIVAFDNIAGAFGGGPIDKVLTADDMVKLRVLGQSAVPAVRWRAVILGTGNAITWRGDTHRRVLIPKLEPTVENPEERVGFAHADLRAWVKEERPRLVCAALTLLRAFVFAGRPAGGCKVWGSFEAWSALIPRALVFAGAADPMACRPAVDPDARDEERAGMVAVFDAIVRCAPPEGITARGLIDVLYPSERGGPPDGFDDAREAVEALTSTPTGKRPNGNRLSYVLRKWRRRPLSGRRLDIVTADRKGFARWGIKTL